MWFLGLIWPVCSVTWFGRLEFAESIRQNRKGKKAPFPNWFEIGLGFTAFKKKENKQWSWWVECLRKKIQYFPGNFTFSVRKVLRGRQLRNFFEHFTSSFRANGHTEGTQQEECWVDFTGLRTQEYFGTGNLSLSLCLSIYVAFEIQRHTTQQQKTRKTTAKTTIKVQSAKHTGRPHVSCLACLWNSG